MKKKMVAMLLTAAMVIGMMSGCGSASGVAETEGTEGTAATTAESGEEKTTAEAASEPSGEVDVVTVWSDQYHEKELREQQIAAFNEGEGKELGIQIDYKVYGDSYSDTIRIASQAEEAPGPCPAHGSHSPASRRRRGRRCLRRLGLSHPEPAQRLSRRHRCAQGEPHGAYGPPGSLLRAHPRYRWPPRRG